MAVIDSGVNRRHPTHRLRGGRRLIEADGGITSDDYTDLLEHGTAVMAAIQDKAPGAEYFAVRVFQRELRTSASDLLRAIEWCIEQKIDVVNL